MILSSWQTATIATRRRTLSSSSAAAISLILLSLSSVSELADAWGCRTCRGSSDNSQGGVLFIFTVENCDACLDAGEVSCEDDDSDLPLHSFCEWREETGRDLSVGNFFDCLDWQQFDEDTESPIDNLSIVNAESSGSRCYTCEDEICTRVYSCGDTSYSCSSLFDIAIIQFNSDPGSSCRSLVPTESNFVYCNEPVSQFFTESCEDLCNLESDEDIRNHICPNGQPIDSYWTVCNADSKVAQFARDLAPDDLPGEVFDEITMNTNLLDTEQVTCVDVVTGVVEVTDPVTNEVTITQLVEQVCTTEGFNSFYEETGYSCVNLGQVICEQEVMSLGNNTPESTTTKAPKAPKTSKAPKTEKASKAPKQAKTESCRRNLRPSSRELEPCD